MYKLVRKFYGYRNFLSNHFKAILQNMFMQYSARLQRRIALTFALKKIIRQFKKIFVVQVYMKVEDWHVYMFEVSINPEYGVYANVELTVDATNAADVNGSMEAFENSNTISDWSIDTDCNIFHQMKSLNSILRCFHYVCANKLPFKDAFKCANHNNAFPTTFHLR